MPVRSRNIAFTSIILCLATFSATPLQAQVCSGVPGGPQLGFDPGPAEPGSPALNCNPLRCHPPELAGAGYETVPSGCDPSAGTCSVRARVPVVFPGNDQNPTQFGSPARIEWRFSNGNFAGSCGSFAGVIDEETGEAWIQAGGFSCSGGGGSLFDVYEMTAIACPGVGGGCEMSTTTSVDLSPAFLSLVVCPPAPPPWSCMEASSCPACSGASGGVSVGGGGAAVGGPGFGGGAFLYYLAGGAGHPAHPKPADWNTLLGRYWSHDYAQRIVPDPDQAHVWLLTEHASFREFTDGDADGHYETAVPSDEYRRLEKIPSGWQLIDLDGTETIFDDDGRWTRTSDRNGNAKVATYTAGVLTSVAFPDSRREHFAYHPSGKLASITEVGVDGVTTRTWSLTWAGDDLARLDRPDGTAFEFFYDDPAHPGYLTHLDLVGTDGTSRRVQEAWEYDSRGNVIRNWQGDADPDGPNAVSTWELSFDDALLPAETTVTDPLGTVSTYAVERDPVSRKPRVAEVSGDCPTCGLGPNTQLSYDDPANPLRKTQEIDARGTLTLYAWNTDGQLTSRAEAVGTALERTTRWQYDATYPALVSEVERPSTTGDPLDFRRDVTIYDALGNPESRIQEGFEAGAPFSYETVTTFNAAGQPLTIDPPGHGTADQTSFTYDPARGDLIVATRTDPLIGTTTFGHDAFNRSTSVTDVNGVTTETVYDALDRVRFTIQHGATPAEDLVTEHRYTVFGDLFQTLLPEGNVIEHGYDSAGRLISIERKGDALPASHGERTSYTLDAFGHRVREELQRWDGVSWVTESATEWLYTNRCQVDQVIAGAGSAAESVTEFAYDCEGNLERVWDANHPSGGQSEPASTVYAYDELNRLMAVTQPWGGAGGGSVVTDYQYDVQDHLTQVVDGEGTVTSYVYSDRDLMTQEISEVSGTTVLTYDEHGELASRLDARGILVQHTVDALDRVTFVDYPDDSLDVTYIYDDPGVPFSLGRLTSIERDGHAIDYRYDRFGRTTQDGELSYVHDRNGNRTEIGYPGGVRAIYSHDFADREQSLDLEVPGEPLQAIVTSASYEPSGPLRELQLGNGLTETHEQDERYFPERITVAGASALLDWQYTTDGVGNPTQITDLLDAAGSRDFAYQEYQYYLTVGNGPWGDLSWGYDRIGNRLSETRDGVTDVYGYVPNLAGGHSPQLDEIQLGAGGTKSFTFDPAGNQTQETTNGEVVDMAYDAAGRLASISRPSAGVRSDFLYDGRSYLRHAEEVRPDEIFVDDFETGDLGCWSVVVGGPGGGGCPEAPFVDPVYSSDGVLHAHLKPDGLARHVLRFSERPLLTAELPTGGSSTLAYLYVDHLGTPISARTGDATLVWTGGFKPFGEAFSGTEGSSVFLRAAGQWHDNAWQSYEVGLEIYYNLHRWYQPATGRYIRPDPLGRPSSDLLLMEVATADIERSSFYAYVASNPMAFVDPWGLFKTQGCTSQQDKQIQDAKKEHCAKIADPLFTTCCESPALVKKLMKLCGDPSVTVRCKASCKERPGFLNCGWAAIFGKTIRLCPDAWKAGCGPLGCTLLHELTHISGHPREKLPTLVEKCLGCPQ